MKLITRWVLVGTAVAAVTGALYAMPVLAAGTKPAVALKSPGSSNMQAMHDVMQPLMSQMPAMHTQVTADIAKALGISTDDLNAAFKNGQSLTDLAAAKNVPIGDIRAIMTRSMTSFLDQAVANQSITPDQKAQLLGYMEQNMDSCLTKPMGSGMMGH